MGWVFPTSITEEPGAEPDPFNGAKSIRELYELASTNYTGKYTVPVSSKIKSTFQLSFALFYCFLSMFKTFNSSGALCFL